MLTLSKDLFAGKGFSMIRRTARVIHLYLPQQTNTCSSSATKTLETTEGDSNENIFKKQLPDMFYIKSVLHKIFSKIHRKTA